MRRLLSTILLLFVSVVPIAMSTASALESTSVSSPGSFPSVSASQRRRRRRRGYRGPVHLIKRPADATARCVDGTYSFSLHRRGTCSHHRGVSVWY